MEISKVKFWLGALAVFVLGWGLSYFTHTKTLKIEDKRIDNTYSSTSSHSSAEDNSLSSAAQASAPPYVLETLEYILEHHEAPDGYVGGRIFQNREGILPKTNTQGTRLKYQEWDVHPKISGENRGAERLVTSNEGQAYYTKDHYRSFTQLK